MASSKQKVTRVAFVVDRSGSMQGVMPAAIDALNGNIASIKESVKGTDQDATVTLIIFDTIVEALFYNNSVSAVQKVTTRDIMPRGMTAMFDAVAKAIEMLQQAPIGQNEDVSYLVNVITDGQENSSIRYNARALNQLIKSVQSTDRWTLTFLVPPGDSSLLTGTFGIPAGNVMEWEGTAQGVKTYSTANNVGISNYFVSRASGATKVDTFYTNVAQVSKAEVKAELTDVTNKVKVFDVKNEDSIQSFIEKQGLTYVKGSAFYELVPGKKKADLVQSYKEIMVMAKNDKVSKKGRKIYTGTSARQVLGLPQHGSSIRPGDHGDWTIFIQSTSLNRKLKAGTRVVYYVK